MISLLTKPILGPDATAGEKWIVFAPALIAGVCAGGWFWAAYPTGLDQVWRVVLIALLAIDIVGGILTTAVPSGRRWWANKEKTASARWQFALLHTIHLLIFSWVYTINPIASSSVTVALLIVGTAVILACPPQLRFACGFAVFLAASALTAVTVFGHLAVGWFLPCFFLKIFVSHLPAVSLSHSENVSPP